VRSASSSSATAGRRPASANRASYLLQQQKIRLVLTTAVRPDASPLAAEIADHVHRHGDGVKDLALWVDDARDAFEKAVERGARAVREPETIRDADGEVVVAAIATYGETIHSLIERRNYNGLFLPGFRAVDAALPGHAGGLKYVDHCVGNVELGKMNAWVDFYAHVMGFRNLLTFDDRTSRPSTRR
jgi:4-hydroxyphenylpyruvate dioxygenase